MDELTAYKIRLLPEPMGDSIFAVVGEEFDLLGVVQLLFFSFGIVASRLHKEPQICSGLLVVGIVILIVSQSFANIAMLGLIR